MDRERVFAMTNAEYHSLPSISKSGLDLIHRAPALYRYRRANPTQQTPAMRWGTLVHTAILEPETMAERCIILPDCAPNKPTQRQRDAKKPSDETIAVMAWWDEFAAASSDREVISTDEAAALESIRAMAHGDPVAGPILAKISEVERSIFWTDSDNQIECRCRPDAILDNGFILDVKTTVDASADSFSRSIAQWRYHVQAAFYSDGYEQEFGEPPKGFAFLAIEKEPPYLCAVYLIDYKAVLRGRSEYQADLRTLRKCIDADTWPGLSIEPTRIDLPKWY
jgi:exodeoxyribonuclease VIII